MDIRFLMAQKCSSGIFQNYLIFLSAKTYIKYFSDTTQIDSWKSNGISEENSKNITESDSNFAPTFINHVSPFLNFNGHCSVNDIYILKKS